MVLVLFAMGNVCFGSSDNDNDSHRLGGHNVDPVSQTQQQGEEQQRE